ncbi:MAG: hypothetical protein KBD23_02185 [Gammaproteobacteria bacterium]|nr:hypothetical protein [Gammaproteobacteria bacterium]MBP9728933.1 hypothetical protein [Gammaproteobacteria bacterium]
MPMTLEEIAAHLSTLKEKTGLKDATIKLEDDQDEVDLLQAFLDDPDNIETDDGRIKTSLPHKKILVYAHPDKPNGHADYIHAIDDYVGLEASERLAVQKLMQSAPRAEATPTTPQPSEPVTGPQSTAPTQSVPQAESKPAPQSTPKPPASETPSTFRTMFENVNFTNEYQAIKELSIAQKLHFHHHLREEQIQLLDIIEKSLLSDNKMSDADHAQVFYSILTLAQKNLRNEFRWTELLGFPRTSRLEAIIEKHLNALSTHFPNIKPLANQEQLKALLVQKALTSIEEHIDKLLKPHGFLQAVKAFVKEGLLNLLQPPKPKS